MGQRLERLTAWASANITRLTGINDFDDVEMVSGDASFRRYFRLRHDARSWVLVDAPPEKENSQSFIEIAEHWHQGGVRVPEVLASDLQQGFMLLEDFGDQLMWPALQGANDEPRRYWYRQAMEQLLVLQRQPRADLPLYDAELLDREMALFPDWLCEQQLELALSDIEKAMLEKLFKRLRERALGQTQVVVHRDYHSRNLMLLPNDQIGVIDFQDAVFGPVTYDLVSLLRDCYVRWDDELVTGLAQEFWQKAQETGLIQQSWTEFQIDFDWMGMQRHLKAAGIFARLNIRDAKPGYLNDIPNTCQYLLEVSARYAAQYPEFADFNQWLESRFIPALDRLPTPELT